MYITCMHNFFLNIDMIIHVHVFNHSNFTIIIHVGIHLADYKCPYHSNTMPRLQVETHTTDAVLY